MAKPKWHVLATTPIAVVAAVKHLPQDIISRESAILISAVLLGVFIDVDHLSIRRIKRIIAGQKGPVADWINWLHTWQAMLVIAIFSLVLQTFLPFMSYLIHILIDGANRDNLLFNNSPLPRRTHPFYPRQLTYRDSHIKGR